MDGGDFALEKRTPILAALLQGFLHEILDFSEELGELSQDVKVQAKASRWLQPNVSGAGMAGNMISRGPKLV
jgi:hypothetical protein